MPWAVLVWPGDLSEWDLWLVGVVPFSCGLLVCLFEVAGRWFLLLFLLGLGFAHTLLWVECFSEVGFGDEEESRVQAAADSLLLQGEGVTSLRTRSPMSSGSRLFCSSYGTDYAQRSLVSMKTTFPRVTVSASND